MNTRLMTWAVLAMLASPAWAAKQTATLSVPTMDCPVCPITVKAALNKVPGVSNVKVDFAKREAIVTYDSTKTTVAALSDATRNAGYPSSVLKAAK
ncbi:MAG: mercury resistance system periplasmic binding protein MerP [Rubrivivax sp.]